MVETLTPGWFAGVVDDLASEAVRGVRADTAVVPVRPSLAQTRVADLATGAAFRRLFADHVGDLMREQARRRERRDRNMAMLLWGVHL